MATRRSNKKGSLSQLPSGSWRAQIYLNGRRISHTEKTKREAVSWLRRTLVETESGLTSNLGQSAFRDFLSSWLISIKASLRSNTWD